MGNGPFAPVAAFMMATACASILLFCSTDWIRFARAGARLFGPQDQYVYEIDVLARWVWGIGMCLLGGALFAIALLGFGRGRLRWSDRSMSWAALGGVIYVLVFAATVWVAEQLAGAATGGPTDAENAAHLLVAAAWPVVAASGLVRLTRTDAPPPMARV